MRTCAVPTPTPYKYTARPLSPLTWQGLASHITCSTERKPPIRSGSPSLCTGGLITECLVCSLTLSMILLSWQPIQMESARFQIGLHYAQRKLLTR